METAGEDLRAARRRRTHEVLSRTAVELALERGASAVTVDDIATAAGVSRRTFFNYFPTKEDALLHGPPPLDPEDIEGFVADTAAPWLTALRNLLTGHAARIEGRLDEMRDAHRLLTANPELLAVMHARFAAFEESLAQVVRRRGEACGAPVDAAVVAAVCTGLLRVAADRWFVESGTPEAGRLPGLVGGSTDALRGLLSS